MDMRNICILLFLVLLPVVSSAQGKIGYTYDVAGNRVKREIVMQASRSMAKQQTGFSTAQTFSEKLRDHTVKLSSNPAAGTLTLNISGLKSTDQCSLEVFTPQGIHILTEDVRSDNTEINISSQPPGVYLLRITVNGKPTTWKITKKE